MADIESRLRAAMQSVGERPPAGLVDGIHARHRRHVRRLTAGCVVAAIAVAAGAPSVARVLQSAGTGRVSSAQGGGSAPGHAPTAPAAPPGTVLSGCGLANPGRVDWTSHAAGRLGASPLWYRGEGHSAGALQLYAGVIVIAGVRPGSTVVLRVAPAGLGQLRFLFGPADSLAPGTRYTSSSGESGVTFVACPPGTGSSSEPGNVTVYYGGFLAPAGRCVPVEVWWSGQSAPITADLGACRGSG